MKTKIEDFLNFENQYVIGFQQNVIIEHQILEDLCELVKENIRFGDILWPSNLPKDEESRNLIEKIEDQLMKNNSEFTRFPSDYVLGLITHNFFESKHQKDDSPLEDKNWKILEIFSYPENSQNPLCTSALYYNQAKNQLVLVNKSMDLDFKNLVFAENEFFSSSIEDILLNEYVPQLAKCFEITQAAYDIAKEKRCSLSFTGYCNGAWLSEYGIYWCERELEKLNPKSDFDVQTKAVLFESPGITKSRTGCMFE
jgi:hypothetical protein